MFPSWEARSVDLRPLPRRMARAGYETLVVGDFAADIFRRIDLGFSSGRHADLQLSRVDPRARVVGAAVDPAAVGVRLGSRRLVPSFDEMHDAADPALLVPTRARRDLGGQSASRSSPPCSFRPLHFPYAAPHPYFNRFSDPAYRGRFKYGKANLLGREAPPDAADVRQIRAAYDGAAAAVDDALGTLIDGLEARGLGERTVIVITADHGESLYESGRAQGHGDHLFGDETTHVPLLIVDPRRPGARAIRGLVRDVDLAPTLVELAGIEPPGDGDGHSLGPALDGQTAGAGARVRRNRALVQRVAAGRAAELRIPYPDLTQLLELRKDHGDDLALRPELELLTMAAKHRMVRDERYKLVYAPTRPGAKYFLFDTAERPGRNARRRGPESRAAAAPAGRALALDAPGSRLRAARRDLWCRARPRCMPSCSAEKGLRLEERAP